MKKFLKLGLIIVLLVSIFSLSQSVWGAFQKLSSLKKSDNDIAQLKAENDKLKKEKAYRQTKFYVEKEAREKLGLSKSGESVFLKEDLAAEVSKGTEKKLSNWEEWVKIFTE